MPKQSKNSQKAEKKLPKAPVKKAGASVSAKKTAKAAAKKTTVKNAKPAATPKKAAKTAKTTVKSAKSTKAVKPAQSKKSVKAATLKKTPKSTTASAKPASAKPSTKTTASSPKATKPVKTGGTVKTGPKPQAKKAASAGHGGTERQQMLNKLKEVLQQKRDLLWRSLNEGDEDIRRETTGDIVDIASGYSETEISYQLAEVGSKELAEVERAFRRFENGSYGLCESCGCEIPIARLKALPFAAKCVPCQESEEEARASGYYFGDD